jgi:hypothetical protein
LLVVIAIELHPSIRVGHQHDPADAEERCDSMASAVRIEKRLIGLLTGRLGTERFHNV